MRNRRGVGKNGEGGEGYSKLNKRGVGHLLNIYNRGVMEEVLFDTLK